jgi:hypothetical protein
MLPENVATKTSAKVLNKNKVIAYINVKILFICLMGKCCYCVHAHSSIGICITVVSTLLCNKVHISCIMTDYNVTIPKILTFDISLCVV